VIYTYVSQKVRIHSEYLVVLKLFLQSNISLEKTGQWPTLTLNHPEGSETCSRVLSVNVCLRNRILDFENGTTVRHRFAFLPHFTNCDHQDTSSGDCNDESHLLLFKIHSFHWHVQNVKISCSSQELLPFLCVI
jgi:hypothetical protein